jgi:hypothetical protein
MDATFSVSIASWRTYYLLAGTSSPTLIGPLLVAVSFHVDLIGESGATTILSRIRHTFTHFILVVIVALLFLVPNQNARGLGLPLLALGLADGLRTLRVGRDVNKARKLRTGVRDAVSRFVQPILLPLVSAIGVILVSATVLARTTSYLLWTVPIVGVLLTSAATSAWDLVLRLASCKRRRAGEEVGVSAAPSGQ